MAKLLTALAIVIVAGLCIGGYFLYKHLHKSPETIDVCAEYKKCLPKNQCETLTNGTGIYVCKSRNLTCCPELRTSLAQPVQKPDTFPKECGLASTDDERITGGEIAGLGQFPWMALLGKIVKLSRPTPIFFCGGTVITSRYVLTAAHCVQNPVEIVRLGEHDLTTEVDCIELFPGETECSDKVLDFEVEKVIIHEKWSNITYKNDIALVKVNDTIPYTNYIRPICLPFGLQLREDFFVNRTFFISGFGAHEGNVGGSDYLQYARIALWEIPHCNKILDPKMSPIKDSQLCGIGSSVNIDNVIKIQNSCRGDSGGPMTSLSGTVGDIKYYQFGIVSFGIRQTCTNGKLPTIYTRVDYYLKWIVDNAA